MDAELMKARGEFREPKKILAMCMTTAMDAAVRFNDVFRDPFPSTMLPYMQKQLEIMKQAASVGILQIEAWRDRVDEIETNVMLYRQETKPSGC